MAEIQTIILYCSLFISLFFEVFLLITYLEVREELVLEEKMLSQKIERFPSVSIIVPCFNEETTLKKTILSLLNLDYPANQLKIIAVDDGSTDGTLRELAQFENHPQISILTKENGGKYTALNLALEKAQSDLVGCLDADSLVNSDALKKIVPFFDDTSTMAVTSAIKVIEPRSVLQYAQKIEYNCSIFIRRMLSSIGALYVTPGPFSIFRTQVFRELGGYRHGYQGEDVEIALRMQKHRYKIVNSHMAHVYTTTPMHFGALYKQRVRWVYSFLNNAFDYREMFFNRKYGHVGIFILPVALSSIFSVIYVTLSTVWNSVSRVLEAFTKFKTVGFDWNFSTFSFDWFFFNTSAIPFLLLGTIIFTFIIFSLAIKMADGKVRFSRGVFYYPILYIFIVPLWSMKAVFNIIFKKQTNWR